VPATGTNQPVNSNLPQMFNKSMVVRGKQKLVRELDQAKHRGQLLAHKKKRVLLDLLKLVKDRQMV